MNRLSHSLSNHPSKQLRPVFHKEQMMRGHVLKVFPIAKTAQIRFGKSIIVAKLQADLMVGRVYWFSVVERIRADTKKNCRRWYISTIA
ncbi:hypothetical protein [Bacillus sp. JCM 19041]|uniref:hypothetical protein n=1 Tax=Bacillus sp. JCM 19041 TaxID=1460637 RepID=UPI0006D0AB94